MMTIMTTTIKDNNSFICKTMELTCMCGIKHGREKIQCDSHCATAEICVSHKNLRKLLFFPLFSFSLFFMFSSCKILFERKIFIQSHVHSESSFVFLRLLSCNYFLHIFSLFCFASNFRHNFMFFVVYF